MPNSREIKSRIKSAENIKQITKAMEMVAAARLRRAQEKAVASKPYTEKIQQVLSSLALHAGDVEHPLLAVREVAKVAYVVLGSDKGLAGAYNSNVNKFAKTAIDVTENVDIITVGRKPRDFFSRRGFQIVTTYSGFSERPTYQNAVEIAQYLTEKFTAEEYDEIYLVSTEFKSPINHHPVATKLLPLDNQSEGETAVGGDYLFEPSAGEVLGLLLPKYVETVIYGALLQSAASELGARMAAMGAASDNAKDLISQLILNYNKVRQALITREISEIVSGAEALK